MSDLHRDRVVAYDLPYSLASADLNWLRSLQQDLADERVGLCVGLLGLLELRSGGKDSSVDVPEDAQAVDAGCDDDPHARLRRLDGAIRLVNDEIWRQEDATVDDHTLASYEAIPVAWSDVEREAPLARSAWDREVSRDDLSLQVYCRRRSIGDVESRRLATAPAEPAHSPHRASSRAIPEGDVESRRLATAPAEQAHSPAEQAHSPHRASSRAFPEGDVESRRLATAPAEGTGTSKPLVPGARWLLAVDSQRGCRLRGPLDKSLHGSGCRCRLWSSAQGRWVDLAQEGLVVNLSPGHQVEGVLLGVGPDAIFRDPSRPFPSPDEPERRRVRTWLIQPTGRLPLRLIESNQLGAALPDLVDRMIRISRLPDLPDLERRRLRSQYTVRPVSLASGGSGALSQRNQRVLRDAVDWLREDWGGVISDGLRWAEIPAESSTPASDRRSPALSRRDVADRLSALTRHLSGAIRGEIADAIARLRSVVSTAPVAIPSASRDAEETP